MLDESEFIGVDGLPDMHDATIVSFQHAGSKVLVTLESLEQRAFRIEFDGVESVRSNRPKGMMVYSLAERSSLPPMRRFVIVNWDEVDLQ